MGQAEGLLRIGELSQRTGVSPELLRAWQRRYSLLQPERSPGGFRLYSPDDEARVLRMKEHMARGIAAAQAARLASSTEPAGRSQGSITELHAALGRALGSFDESGAQGVLDEAFDAYSLDAVIGDLLIPYLHELGERWSRGEVTVAQEHFASNLIRGVCSVSLAAGTPDTVRAPCWPVPNASSTTWDSFSLGWHWRGAGGGSPSSAPTRPWTPWHRPPSPRRPTPSFWPLRIRTTSRGKSPFSRNYRIATG